MQWQSKLEWREDTGLEQLTQWVTTNKLLYRVNEDWRIGGRLSIVSAPGKGTQVSLSIPDGPATQPADP